MTRRVLVVDDSATLRKLVRVVLEEAGYEVETASDGAEGLDRVQRAAFDLCLVDFVMPRLNGYQLTQAIRSIPSLRALPVVLMSAKADQIGPRFIAQTGAVAALAKPFPPDSLLGAVRRAIQEPSTLQPPGPENGVAETHPDGVGVDEAVNTVPPPPDAYPGPSFPPALAPARDSVTGETTAPSQSVALDAFQVSTATRPIPAAVQAAITQESAHRRFAQLLGRALLPVFEDLAQAGGDLNEAAIVEAVRLYLPPSELVAVARELRQLDLALRGPVALEGILGLAPLGEIVQLLHLQSQTGLLVIEREGVEVTVAFRDGKVDLALASGLRPEFLLGRYLVADGLIDRPELEAFAAAAVGQKSLLGEALLRAGYLRPDDLERALTRQTSELVYEVLRWNGGRFRFEAGAVVPEAQLARLSLSVETLVLEGFRRIDEWRLIAELVPSDDLVLARDEALVAALAAERLDRDERRVLDAIDGRRAVRDVVALVSLSSFDGCKILYRLLRARLARQVAS